MRQKNRRPISLYRALVNRESCIALLARATGKKRGQFLLPKCWTPTFCPSATEIVVSPSRASVRVEHWLVRPVRESLRYSEGYAI